MPLRSLSVLVAIYNLLESPNPDDPLVASIAEVYNTDKTKFKKTAKEWVKKVSYSLSSNKSNISTLHRDAVSCT